MYQVSSLTRALLSPRLAHRPVSQLCKPGLGMEKQPWAAHAVTGWSEAQAHVFASATALLGVSIPAVPPPLWPQHPTSAQRPLPRCPRGSPSVAKHSSSGSLMPVGRCGASAQAQKGSPVGPPPPGLPGCSLGGTCTGEITPRPWGPSSRAGPPTADATTPHRELAAAAGLWLAGWVGVQP